MNNEIDPFQVPTDTKNNNNNLDFEDMFGENKNKAKSPAKEATLDFKDINNMGMQLQNRL